MTRVEAIVPAKRRSGWMEIRLDGASAILMPQEDVDRLALAAGDLVDPGRLSDLRRDAARAEAMRIALRYLSHRPRSRREVRLRLERDSLGAETIGTVLARCEDLGYLDDRAFAAAFARDRIRLRPSGERRLRAELASRGVSEADASAGIRDAMRDESVTENDLLDREASRRLGRLCGVDRDAARRRLYRGLLRRGFEAYAIRRWIDAHAPAEAGARDTTDERSNDGI